VSEVVLRDGLCARAAELAGMIAAKPPAAIQGSVKAIWESLGHDPLRRPAGRYVVHPDRPYRHAQVDRSSFAQSESPLR
jgi:hypothetical protein